MLFLGWIGWLVYLAATGTPRPPLLSRSQLLVSNLDVIASIDQLEGNTQKIKIDRVHWPQTQKGLEGQTIDVPNLSACDGWKGPGPYIVPLSTNWKGSYQVAPPGPSPGFEGGRPRIYPVTAATIRQLDEISKPDIGSLAN